MTFDNDGISVNEADAATSAAHRGRRTWQVTDNVGLLAASGSLHVIQVSVTARKSRF